MTKKEFVEFAIESNAQKPLKNKTLQAWREVYIKSASAFVIHVAELLKEKGYKMIFFIPQRPRMAKYRFTWADIKLVETSTKIFCIDDYKTFGNDMQLNSDIVTLVFGNENNAIINSSCSDEEILKKIEKAIVINKFLET